MTTQKEEKAQHTPERLPWKIREESAHHRGYVLDNGGLEVAEIYGLNREERAQRLAFICRAVNSHEALVEACKLVLKGLKNGSIKSNPIIKLDSSAREYPMTNLANEISAALALAGEGK
jgi:hypothetical protein